MIKSIDQELYDRLYIDLSKNHDVYHKLPPKNAKYPCYHMGLFVVRADVTKCTNKGILSATIHVWSDERFGASTLSETALEHARRIDTTDRFNWYFNGRASGYRVLEDNSTVNTLFHGVVDIEYKYIERR